MPAFWLYYYSILNLGTNNTPEIRNGVRNIHLHQWLWETWSLSTLSFYLIHRKKGGGKGTGAEVRSWVESWGRAPGLIRESPMCSVPQAWQASSLGGMDGMWIPPLYLGLWSCRELFTILKTSVCWRHPGLLGRGSRIPPQIIVKTALS